MWPSPQGVFWPWGLYFSLHISLNKCSSEKTFGKIDANNWLTISPICCLLRDGTCSSICHTCYRVGLQFLFPFLSPFLKVKWMFFFITKRKTFCLYRCKYTQGLWGSQTQGLQSSKNLLIVLFFLIKDACSLKWTWEVQRILTVKTTLFYHTDSLLTFWVFFFLYIIKSII